MESVEQPGGASQRAWRVLVVDDEENLNWSLVASLRRENYAADGALTAEEARRRLTETPYDCVISDVKMPGIDGFQLLSWLRDWRPSTRVIMMTAFGSPSVRQEALRNGVIAYLEKPFDLRALKQELRRTLEGRVQQPASYDLIDITQAINVGRRDVAAQVMAGGQTGQLVFERGDLVSAEYGDLRGDEAFQAMCAAPAQRIQQAPPPATPERNVTQPVSALIFDALLARNSRPAGTGSLTAPPVASPQPVPQPVPHSAPLGTTTGQMPLAQASAPDVQRALAGLAATIALPCAVALLTPTGVVKAVAQTAQPPMPNEMFAYLAQAMQATARAARVGQWGAIREARLAAGERQALVRLLGQSVDTLALVVVSPAQMDARQLDAAVAAHEGALRASATL
ncbi:MAG TPA: response regulator [Ktedonobacterales bacterium]|nr:response regulator [Ktedonobacterales bacterium]